MTRYKLVMFIETDEHPQPWISKTISENLNNCELITDWEFDLISDNCGGTEEII